MKKKDNTKLKITYFDRRQIAMKQRQRLMIQRLDINNKLRALDEELKGLDKCLFLED